MVRRLRAVLVTALSWAVFWLPFGFLMPLFRGPPPECLYCPPNWFILFLLTWCLSGGVSGAAFALVLMIAERRHSLAELSMARVASWGAIGAAILPLVLVMADIVQSGLAGFAWGGAAVILGIAGSLGAVCATVTLALARRGQTSSLAV